jgi:hypothetical protein
MTNKPFETHEELITSPEYHTIKIQIDLANLLQNQDADSYNKLLSKRQIRQTLNGDFDDKLSSMVRLIIATGHYPVIEFRPLDELTKKS